MRFTLTLIFTSLIQLYLFCQDTIDVVEKTIKVGGFAREIEYYGFAEGDKVIFNLTVENKKELKEIIISEYPSNVKFADHTTGLITNKIVNVLRKGVYSFEYYNSNMSGRTVTVKIQRIPKSEGTKFFNTNVEWVNYVDTTYSAQKRTYLIGSDTSFENVIDSKVRVHSQTNANPNKSLISFTLPANTIRWTYWIGVDQEGQDAFEKDQADFSKMGTKLISNTNPLVGLALGLFTMSHTKIGENVQYWFISSKDNAQRFSLNQDFMAFKKGNVVTDFGLMNYANQINQTYYVGLMNDNVMQGIDVNVKILAVVVKNKYDTVIEKVPTYTNKLTPKLKE